MKIRQKENIERKWRKCDSYPKNAVVKETYLNMLKLTGIFFPYYIIRWVFRKIMNIKGKELFFLPNQLSFFRNECPPEYYESYHKYVVEGYKRMAEQKAVFCGCVRDTGELMDITIDRLEKTGLLFKDYRIVIFESDSKDKTLEVLKRCAFKNNKIIVLSERKGFWRYVDHGNKRMRIMAYCRNKYLRYVQDNLSDFDYMFVLDMDIFGGWSNEGIANSIGHDNWDMIGANSLGYGDYYDSYPLRIKDFEDRCYVGGRQSKYNPKMVSKNKPEWINSKQPILNCGEELMPVVSCFAGLGIYKMETIKNCAYGSDDCEHVVIHKGMHKNGYNRFFINPSMIAVLK